ncbi:MAG: nitroreductase family protein [Chthoniobacterales bacterium]|nr:nitroreductase family protein [Chthoniobacterales bacterium]
METFEAIYGRRAVKAFDPNHRMTEGEVRRLLEAAMQSPTAFNIQHWRALVVTDPELRKQIRAVAWDQPQVTDASLLVILTGDLMAWKKDPSRYWRNAPKETADFLVKAIYDYYAGKPDVQRDEVMRSCGMFGQTLMLAAQAMGYQSCPMDGFDFDAVARLINLPPDHVISFMIAIGKGIKEPWPKPGQLSYDEVVIQNKFPNES